MTEIARGSAAEAGRCAALWIVPGAVRLGFAAWLVANGAALDQLLHGGDAAAFLRVAHAFLEPAGFSELSGPASRVFPLWPMVLAAPLALGLPAVALLLLNPLLSGAVSWMFYRVTRNFGAALLLGFAPPVAVVSGVLPMSETLYLGLGLGAAGFLARGHLARAGLLAGAMVAARPFGLAWVAAGALTLWFGRDGKRGRALMRFGLGAAAGLAPLVGFNLVVFGDVLHQVRVYGQDLATLNVPSAAAAALGGAQGHWDWPLRHVLLTPWRIDVPLWKTIYIYAHVAALLLLVPLALRRFWAGRGAAGPGAGNFLLLAFAANSALAVCAGPYWGFHSFDRYVLWGAPGGLLLVWSLASPATWRWLAPVAAVVSLACAMFALQRFLA